MDTTINPTAQRLLDLANQRQVEEAPAPPRHEKPAAPAKPERVRDDLTWDFDKIRFLADARGIDSMTELAKEAGMHRQEFYRIKSGKSRPTTYTIAKLCRVLKCQPRAFLSYDED